MPNIDYRSSLSFTGKVDGFAEFDQLLSILPQKVEENVLQSAAIGAMKIGVKAVAAAAPEDEDRPSSSSLEYWWRKSMYGRLKDNIKVKASKRDKNTGQRGAYITTGKAFWGHFLEKGTRYIAAKPWFLPAFSSVKDKIIAELGRRIGAGIVREAMKKTEYGAALRGVLKDGE